MELVIPDEQLKRIVEPMVEQKVREMLDLSDEGVSADEAAKLLGVKKWRVYEMCREGKLPSYRPSSKTLRIRRRDIDAYKKGELENAA